MCVCVCVCVCTGETNERVQYFISTKSVSDLYSMHGEEEYCNTSVVVMATGNCNQH